MVDKEFPDDARDVDAQAVEAFVQGDVPVDQLAAASQADVFADATAMHHLLQAHLDENAVDEKSVLAGIHAGIGTRPDVVQFPRQPRPWRRTVWVLAAAFVAQVLIVGTWLYLSDDDYPDLRLQRQHADGSWVDSNETVRLGMLDVGSSGPLRVHVGKHVIVDLTAESYVRLASISSGDPWTLLQGQVDVQMAAAALQDVQTAGFAIQARTAVVSGTGRWRLQRGMYRDRVFVYEGQAAVQQAGRLAVQVEAGALYDCALGAPVRRVPAVISTSLPLRLGKPASDAAYGADIMARLPAGSGQLSAHDKLHVPFMAPPAYSLTMQVERQSGDDVFVCELPRSKQAPVCVMLDGWQGTRHGVQLLGGEADRLNATAVWTDTVLPLGSQRQVQFIVRPAVIACYVDGDLLTWWHVDERIPAALAWPVADDKGGLRLHARSGFVVTSCQYKALGDMDAAALDMYGPQLQQP